MEKPQTSDPEGTKYFRATYELPSDVDATATQTLHDAYLQGLHDGRKLRAAGPYVNNPAAGLAILSVPNAE